MSRRAWRLLALALGVVALVIAWQAWEEWRVRRRLDEALAKLQPFVDGPVDTWLARLPEPRPPNASLRRLERLAHATPIDLTDDHVRHDAWRQMRGNAWMKEIRSYVEAEVAREQVGAEPAAFAPPAFVSASPHPAAIIGLDLLTQPLPEWPAERHLSAHFRNQLPWMWLTELLLADALMRHDRGDDEGAAMSTEAAWQLVEMLRRREDMISQLLAWREARLCAGVVRQLEGPDPEWRKRLDIEPFRQALLHATLVECFKWHEAARAGAIPRGWSPPPQAGSVLAKLPHVASSCGAERREVADAIEATVPFLRALEAPGRCGPSTIPSSPVGAPGKGIGALGDATAFIEPLILERLDRLRVDFELTRRVLDLREKRAKDPGGRWPVALGEEESECPGVRFMTTEPQPGLVLIEAVSPAGDPWLDRYPALIRPPLRVELVQPPP